MTAPVAPAQRTAGRDAREPARIQGNHKHKGAVEMTRLLLTALAVLALLAPAAARASDQGLTSLAVNGEQVRIYRDEFGVPHIFAETNRGLFEAYGYTVAQDRLWQLELVRRSRQGRLAEIFGPGSLNSDINVRTFGYTGAELDAQLAALTAEETASAATSARWSRPTRSPSCRSSFTSSGSACQRPGRSATWSPRPSAGWSTHPQAGRASLLASRCSRACAPGTAPRAASASSTPCAG